MSHVHGCNLQKDECIDLYRDQLKTWRHNGQELETQVERLSSEVAEQAAEIETVTLREKATGNRLAAQVESLNQQVIKLKVRSCRPVGSRYPCTPHTVCAQCRR